jgi:hypothetical protein
MEHHQILPFLSMCGMVTIFLIGELGIRDQQNGLHVNYFYAIGPGRNSASQNQDNWVK